MNKMIFTGHLGKDPESRFAPSGQQVTSFSVASSRQYNNSTTGERVKETTWFRVSTWGKLAEICQQYLKKGSHVLVEGRLTPDKATGGPRIWTKQDGDPGASYEVTAMTVEFLSPRGESTGNVHHHEDTNNGAATEEGYTAPEDDIPF